MVLKHLKGLKRLLQGAFFMPKISTKLAQNTEINTTEDKTMIRGTTPTHTFIIPIDTSLLKEVKIAYAQDDVPIVKKELENCVLEGNKIITTLTQEETLKFNHKKNVEIQVRVLTIDGTALASVVKKVDVGEVLDDEVME